MNSGASCIYQGSVRHRRFTPVDHSFRFSLFMMYLDLSEMESLFRSRWLWSIRRPNLARFRREDHLGDHHLSLEDSVRDLVQEKAGRRPAGPIRLLTHLRYFGHCFNPISVYYCFDEPGEEITHLVAEVSNTPWGERHCYVLPADDDTWSGDTLRTRTAKEFHVSPFMEMQMEYAWTLTRPADRLVVHIENRKDDRRVFDATLDMERRPITTGSLARVLARYPLMTGQVTLAIHYQALKLWLKKVQVHPHPRTVAPMPQAGKTHDPAAGERES